jgi:hypothetical protein
VGGVLKGSGELEGWRMLKTSEDDAEEERAYHVGRTEHPVVLEEEGVGVLVAQLRGGSVEGWQDMRRTGGSMLRRGAGFAGDRKKCGVALLHVTWHKRLVSSYISSWVAHKDPEGTKW